MRDSRFRLRGASAEKHLPVHSIHKRQQGRDSGPTLIPRYDHDFLKDFVARLQLGEAGLSVIIRGHGVRQGWT